MRTILTGSLRLSLILLVSGCGMSEDAFFESLYAEQCAYEFACQPGISEEAYGDEAGCQDVYGPYIEDGLTYFEGCRFDSGAARDCLKTLRNMGCVSDASGFDPLLDTCDPYEIWTCEVE